MKYSMSSIMALMNLKLIIVLLMTINDVSGDYDLTILHTGDFRTYFEEMNLFYEPCTVEDKERNQCFGGWARLDTLVKGYRKMKDNLLVLDVGNQFHGTLWFNVYRHESTAYFMNRTEYDAMALGWHEFDLKPSGLFPFLDTVTFPVLSCNIDDTNEPIMQGKYKKYDITFINGQRIGLIGFSYWNSPEISNTGELKFHGEVAAVRSSVEELQKLGVNKIIVLGRSYFDLHMKIAQEVEGVDIVIGGDFNEFLYTGNKPPSVEEPTNPYPIVVQPDGDTSTNVLLVQAYWAGKYVGHLDVTFDDNGNVIDWDGNPIILDGDVEQDEETLQEINEWAEKVHEYGSEHFGETNVFLAGTGPYGEDRHSPCRFGECPLGNMVTDAFIQQSLTQPTERQWNAAAISFINAGGMRDTLDVGEITRGHVLALFPFSNTIDSLDIQGRHLLEVLEHSAAGYNISDGEHLKKFLQLSGIKLVYDLSRPDGQRVQNVTVLCTECQIPEYEPLDVDKTYSVITTSFLAGGGDNYDMIPEHKTNHIEGPLDTEALEAYIRQMSPLYHHGQMGRIRFADDKPLPCNNATHLNASAVSMVLAIVSVFVYCFL